MVKVIFLIIAMLLLASCSSDQRILERIGFTQSTSYDLMPDSNKLKVTISVPKGDPDSKVLREVLTAVVDTSKEAKLVFSRQTNVKLVDGQLRTALFGLNLANQGLWNHIDTLMRDPSIALRVKVAVVEGDAGSLLGRNYVQHPRTGQYINRLLEKEASSQTIPKVTLYEFSRDYYDDGIDPVVPILKVSGKDIIVNGIALFQDDRYKMKIAPRNAVIFAFFQDSFKQGAISIDLNKTGDPTESVMFGYLINKRSVRVQIESDNHYKVLISASIQGSVLEYIGKLQLSNEEERKQLESEISAYITKEAKIMIKEMQRNNVDSLGIGQYVRNSISYKQWKNLNWRNVYPTVEVECNAKIRIRDYGKFK